MTFANPLDVAAEIAAILDRLGIPYVVGGSVAASLVGEPRSTLDLDVMIDAGPDDAARLARALGESCYVDEATAVEAARRRSAFNAIHLASSLKIDFFFAEDAAFAREALAHRQTVRIGTADIAFYAVEDLVVRKLWWFRAGDETSERQWRDVLGILRLNRDSIDRERLQLMAADAGVSDLLERAARESE